MLLNFARQSLLHHETYISVLKGLLPHGTERQFAREVVGMTPNYLSNILSLDHPPPSPAMAARIVSALPIDGDRKRSLLEHMLLASETRQKLAQAIIPLWREPLLPVMQAELYSAIDQAEYGGRSSDIRWYRVVAEVGQALLRQFEPARHLLDYVHICLVVQNVLAILNRHEDALYTAQLATALLETRDPSSFGEQRDRFHSLWINSWYAQSVAVRNVDQPKRAQAINELITSIIATETPEQASFWLPHNLMSQLEALSRIGRFTLHEANSLFNETQRLCQRRDFVDTEQLLLLNEKAMINANVRYGINNDSQSALRKALQLARRLADVLAAPKLRIMPIQRATTLNAVTSAYYQVGDIDGWQHYLKEWVTVSEKAGLTHQLAQARQQYGPIVDAISADYF